MDIRKNERRNSRLLPFRKWAFAAIPAIATIGFIEELYTRQGVDDWVWYLVSLALTIFVGGSLLPIELAALFSVLTLIGFYFSPLRTDAGLALTNCLMGMGVLWITAVLVFLRKQGESALPKLACAVEQSPAAIMITDLRGNIEYVNTAFCDLTGYTLEEIRGQNPRILKSGSHDTDFYQVMWEVLLQGNTWRGELRNKKKNGELYWESACISPVRDGRGETTHYVGIKEDITARKRATEALKEAEQKLVASERQQRAILESITDPAWLRDRQGRFQMVNRAWCEFARITAEQALGKTVAEVSTLYPPDVASEIQTDDERVMATGKSSQADLQFNFAKQGVVWFETSKTALVNESGKTYGLVGIARDITKRKRASLELAESRTFLDRIINAIGDPVFVKDRQHRLILINDANCALLRRERQAVLGKTDFDLFPQEEANGFWMRDESVFGTGREDLCEEHLTDAAGNVHTLLTRKSLYTNIDGEQFIVAVLRDITESKRMEENLRQSEEKFRQFAENIHEVFWMTSADRRKLLFVSPAYEKIWGRTCESLYANPIGWLESIHPEDRPAILEAARNHYAGFLEGIEYRIARPDGSLRWIRDRAYSIRDGTGQINRMVGIAEDITERRRVEMEEQKKTALFESLVNSSPDGILVTSAHGQKIVHNEQCHQLFRIPEHIAKQVDNAEQLQYLADSMRDPEQFLKKVLYLESHPEETGRDEIEFKDGRVLDRNSAPVFGANQEYYGRIWTFRDITERKKTESAMRKLACAVEQSPVSIVITDVRGKIEYVNPKFCAATGYSVEELHGQNPRLLKSGETSSESYRQLWATITAGREWHGEFHNRKKNGELYWEFASISPIRDEQGKITHFVAVKEDITQRKLLGLQIDQLRNEREIILNTIGEGVHWIDVEGRIKFENPAAARMLGYEFCELIGRPAHVTIHHSHADGSAYAQDDCPITTTLRDGVTRRVTDEVFWRKDGSCFPVEYSCTPVWERDGRSGGTVVIFTDVTARKEAQAELGNLERRVAVHLENEQLARRALAREQELNQIKSRFVSLVSHEFRTPLSVISAAAQLLGRYSDQMGVEERAQECKQIECATRRMTWMMDDLLLHGKLEAGKMECNPVCVDLEPLCRQIILEISKQPAAASAIELAIARDAREAVVDKNILSHILGNLLSNAVKYSCDRQPVALAVNRVAGHVPPVGTPEPRQTNYLELKVSDSGIGIPAADVDKIFQTFHRAANVGNRPGTGMGLAIVKQFVDLHRGRIRVQSVEGRGTTFSVWLPMSSPT